VTAAKDAQKLAAFVNRKASGKFGELVGREGKRGCHDTAESLAFFPSPTRTTAVACSFALGTSTGDHECVLVMDAPTGASALGLAIADELERRKTIGWQVGGWVGVWGSMERVSRQPHCL
jgi:hypothetical protein